MQTPPPPLFPPFSRAQMLLLAAELEKELTGALLTHVIRDEKYRFSLYFSDRKGENRALYICLQSPKQRFHLLSSPLFAKKTWVEGDQLLTGSRLQHAAVIDNERILRLSFLSPNNTTMSVLIQFIPRAPNLTIMTDDNEVLWSLVQAKGEKYVPPMPATQPLKDSPPLFSTHKEIETSYAELEKQAYHTELLQKAYLQLQRKIKQLDHQVEKMENDLKEAIGWKNTFRKAEVLQSMLWDIPPHATSYEAQDWDSKEKYVFYFSHDITPHIFMAQLFQKAKKQKRAQETLKTLLSDLLKRKTNLHEEQQTLFSLSTTELEDKTKRNLSTGQKKEPSRPHPSTYRSFISHSGIPIWVGKEGTSNDQLTFSIARGNDWWVHIKGAPGAHVIIRSSQPDDQTRTEAMQLALHYSKLRQEGKGEIWITQRKYVSKSRNRKPGQVQVAQAKSYWIHANPSLLNEIKNRISNL